MSTALDDIAPSGTQWSCGHSFATHTREGARACLANMSAERLVPRHTADAEGGASAPSDSPVTPTPGTPHPPGVPHPSHAQRHASIPQTAESICQTAADLVGGPRATTHGDKSLNFRNIAELWNGYWRIKCRINGEPLVTPFDAHDVGCMMELFKIARRFSGSFNVDDYIDAAGYAGCAGEVAAKDSKQ